MERERGGGGDNVKGEKRGKVEKKSKREEVERRTWEET
jgi:hypothetical protein